MERLEDISWFKEAACLGLPPEWFYGNAEENHPGKRRMLEQGKEVCAQCPVNTDCLNYAVDLSIMSGLWAGYNFSARKSRNRAQQLRPPQPRQCLWCYGEFTPQAIRSAKFCRGACRKSYNDSNGITTKSAGLVA